MLFVNTAFDSGANTESHHSQHILKLQLHCLLCFWNNILIGTIYLHVLASTLCGFHELKLLQAKIIYIILALTETKSASECDCVLNILVPWS